MKTLIIIVSLGGAALVPLILGGHLIREWLSRRGVR
jgi:hypothetical protein